MVRRSARLGQGQGGGLVIIVAQDVGGHIVRHLGEQAVAILRLEVTSVDAERVA